MLTVFLDVPDAELYARLIARGESEERAKVRLSRGNLERGFKNQYDLVIENTDIRKTIEIIEREIEQNC